MKESQKTKAQLIEELDLLHQTIKKDGFAKTRSVISNQLLADSEIRYRRLFETAQDGILILNADTGQILDVNPFLTDMLGYPHREFIGKKLWEIGPFKDIEASKIAYLELQEKDYVRYENLPLETRDKREIQVEFVSNIYKANHSRIIQCNIRNITERKEIEAGLEKTRKELVVIKKSADEAREFAESIINTVRESLIVLDQDLRVVSVSHSFYEFFKVKPEDTVGHLIYDLGNKQWDIPKLRELLETILPKKTTFNNYEVEHNFATIGRRVMLLNARQIERVLGKERIILLAIEDITERKEIEAGLEKTRKELVVIKKSADEAREFAESIINTVRESLIVLDQDLRVVSVSHSFYEFFKVKPEDTVGHLIYDLGNKQWDIPKLRELLETILPKKTTFNNYEVEHNFATIGRRVMLLNARQIERVLGKERIILLAIEDITERKEIEAGLEKTRKELVVIKKSADEAREFAESIINTVRESLIVLDQDLRVVSVSHSFYEFFKVKPEDTVGHLIYDLGNKQWDIPKLRELLETILPKKTTFNNYEVEHNFATIGRRVMLLNARQIERVLGKERIILLAIEDITERKQIERQLRFHAEVLDKISDAVVVIDNERKVNYWNKGAERLYGISEDEAYRLPVMELYQCLWLKPEDEQALIQALEIREFWSGDNIHIKRDGVRLYVQSSVSNVKDKDGKVIGTMAVIRDVTGRTELDHLKDEFIGLVSHEMRTPLTVIIGGINTALSQGEHLPEDEIKGLLNDALCEAETLSHILDNLLELSRTQAKKLLLFPEPMIMKKLAKDVVNKFKGQSAHQFILDFPSDIPLVEADTLRVSRILYNLVQNAVKYSPAGSKIRIFARQKLDHLVIGVRDQGNGISAMDQARIFHSFQRLGFEQSGEVKGIGLGLMVCLRLVEAHGGKIWVKSAPEKGSTFYFTLPLKQLKE